MCQNRGEIGYKMEDHQIVYSSLLIHMFINHEHPRHDSHITRHSFKVEGPEGEQRWWDQAKRAFT